MKRMIVAVACLMSVACSSDKPATQDTSGDQEPTFAIATETPAEPAPPRPDRLSRYSRLDNCTVIKQSPPGNGDYKVMACPGLAGYRLQLAEGDLRHNLYVLPPGGGEQSLELSAKAGRGGFSRLGEDVEWRGEMQDGDFRPDALILRYFVVDGPDPEKETAYLLTVSLAGDRPCLTGKLTPGRDQNEQARRTADTRRECIE